EEVVTQRKRTFTLPWAEWLRGALKARVAAGFSDWSPVLEPVISKSAADGVWDDFLAGRTSWSRAWSLYVLNEWVKRNLQTVSMRAESGRGVASATPARHA